MIRLLVFGPFWLLRFGMILIGIGVILPAWLLASVITWPLTVAMRD